MHGIHGRKCLSVDLSDDASADCLTTLTESESGSDLEGNIVNELTVKLNVVTGHDELLVSILGARRVVERDGDIRSSDEELRSVVVHEGGVPSTLLLLEDVDLSTELLDGLDRAGDDHDLATLDLLTLDTTEKGTHVVTSHALVELLVEHLDTSEGGLEGVAETKDLNLSTLGDGASLDTASDDGTTTGDGEDVLDGHQEGLLKVTRGELEPLVGLLHELADGLSADLGVPALKSGQGGARDDGSVLTIETVGGEEVPHLHLDEVKHLRVVNLVDLVDEDNELLDTDLLGEEKVLSGLGHLAVSGGDDNDGTVHLSSTSNHVTDVISVTRAVDVGVVAVGSLVLDVSSGDGDTTGTLLRGLVDGSIVDELAGSRSLGKGLGDGSSQGGLTVVYGTVRMIRKSRECQKTEERRRTKQGFGAGKLLTDVANGTNVHVGLVTDELARLGGVGAKLGSDGDTGKGGEDRGGAGGDGKSGLAPGVHGSRDDGGSSGRGSGPLDGKRASKALGCLGAKQTHDVVCDAGKDEGRKMTGGG